MVKAGRTFWRGASPFGMPGVEAYVVVVIARRKKGSLIAVALGDAKSENVAIKVDRTVKIRHLEVDMADAGGGGNSGGHQELHLVGHMSKLEPQADD